MAKMDDLPVELLTFIADNLYRLRDLAALARTSHRTHDAVDPILYKFAKGDVSNFVPWHPLRWAAHHGKTGTLKKALAAGIDVNMTFSRADSVEFHDLELFWDREETADMPRMEPHCEWEPHEDDTDHDDTLSSTSTDDRPGYPPLPRHHTHGRSGVYMYGGEDDWDDPNLSDAMGTDSISEGDSMSIDDYARAAAAAIFQTLPNQPAWADGEDDDNGDNSDEFDGDSDNDLDEVSHDDTHSIERSVRNTIERAHDIGETFQALHLAARAGNDDVVRILLDQGASIDTCSHQLGRRTHLVSLGSHESYGTSLSPADAGYSPLHLAICHLQASTARLLLSRGASPRLSEPQRRFALTALHAAAATGQVDLCKQLLDGGFVELDASDQTGLTPFYYAYRNGQWGSSVPLLLERGADINCLARRFPRLSAVENGESCTPLYEACAFDRYSEAKRLIHLGADVNKGLFARDIQRRSPLHAVCELSEAAVREPYRHRALKSTPASVKNNEVERVELIRLMLKLRADLEATSRPEGASPLHIAAMHRDVAALQVLLAEGADVESQEPAANHSSYSSDGRTALLSACGPRDPRIYFTSNLHFGRGTEIDTVNILMNHGSNLNAQDKAGDTALHLVCSVDTDALANNQDSLLRRLLQKGAEGNVSNYLGTAPFETAFDGGILGVCDLLVRHGCFPRKHDEFERMALTLIKFRAHDLFALDLLLDLDVDEFLFSKSIFLLKMIEGGHVEMASRYLERCPDRIPPLNPKQKLTALREGLARDHEKLVKQMLAMKVSVNVPDKKGHTPLYVAVQRNRREDCEIARALLDAGSDIHFKPPSSAIRTPLEKAIMEEKHALVEIMLHHQPLRDNPRAPRGVYLHAAARGHPSKKMLSTLIRSGASVAELDSNNDTPLSVFLKSIADLPQWAGGKRRAGNRICGTVWYLWNNKVDINFRNKTGKAITSYLAALQMYNGDNPAGQRIANELKLGLEIVPADGADGEKGLKTLRFRHSLMGLKNFRGGGSKPVIRS